MNGFSAEPGERTAERQVDARRRGPDRARRRDTARGSRARAHRPPACASETRCGRRFQTLVRRAAPTPPAAAGPAWFGPAAFAAAMPRVGARGEAARRGRSVLAWPPASNRPARTPTASTRSRTAAAAAGVAVRAQAFRPAGDGDQQGGLRRFQRLRRHAEPGERAGPDAFQVAAERRQGEPDVEHALPAVAGFKLHGAGHLDQLGAEGARSRLEQAGGLHRQCRAAGDNVAGAQRTARWRGPGRAGSTPGWYQKRRSSTAMSRLVSSVGAVPARNRQTPPGAGSSASGRSWRSRTSVPIAREAGEVGREGVVQRRAEGGEQKERGMAGG